MCVDTHNFILSIHSYLRWAILLILLLQIAFTFITFRYYSENQSLEKSQSKAAVAKLTTILTILVDISVVFGIYLYISYLKLKTAGESIMQNPEIRKRLVEHGPLMLVFLFLIHWASIVRKKSNLDEGKRYKKMGIIYLVALLLVLLMTPSWVLRSF